MVKEIGAIMQSYKVTSNYLSYLAPINLQAMVKQCEYLVNKTSMKNENWWKSQNRDNIEFYGTSHSGDEYFGTTPSLSKVLFKGHMGSDR